MDLQARESGLYAWACAQATALGHAAPAPALQPVSGDASFRRYFRLATAGGTLIAVDAPPAHEDCRPFVAISGALCAAGVHAPRVHAVDHAQGYMLLEDLGDRLLLPALDETSVDRHYAQAMQELLRMQDIVDTAPWPLPAYDATRLRNEMRLFPDWFLRVHLDMAPDEGVTRLLEDAFDVIIADNLAQPTVFVHRDFHARNLMLCDDGTLGVIDFQDAVTGPVTYDLVSLLRDAYIAWPMARVQGWALHFARLLRAERRLDADDATFLRWFDLMGAQRHLKVVGIFARLNHRDGKSGYLADMPRVFACLLQELQGRAELAPLDAFLREAVLPRWIAHTPAVRAALAATPQAALLP